MKKALVIIDMQNDFITGSLPVAHSNEIIGYINELMDNFEYVVATQDWHPAKHFSFFTNHYDKKAFETIEKDGYSQTLWPPHCIQGSNGADFYVQNLFLLLSEKELIQILIVIVLFLIIRS